MFFHLNKSVFPDGAIDGHRRNAVALRRRNLGQPIADAHLHIIEDMNAGGIGGAGLGNLIGKGSSDAFFLEIYKTLTKYQLFL